MSNFFEVGDQFPFTAKDERQHSFTLSLQVVKEINRNTGKQVIIVQDIRDKKIYFMKVLFFSKNEQIYVEKESKVQLYSPYLVRIYGGMADYDKGRFLTLIEYVDAPDLATLVRNRQIQGAGPEERMHVKHMIAMKFLYGIRHYMSLYEEDPIVHRDLKPENLVASGDGNLVKIIDFDWVHLHHSNVTVMSRREQKGTPGYVDPHYWNSYQVSVLMDIYSAGLVIYYLYMGRAHFSGGEEIERYMVGDDYAYTLHEMPGIDPELVAILRKMIAREEERYQTIDQVIGDMKSYLTGVGEKLDIVELLESDDSQGDDDGQEPVMRLLYRVGNIHYNAYIRPYHFVPIDFGRRQKRSRNGRSSGHILSFYRMGDQLRAVRLKEDCKVIQCQDLQNLQDGDTFLYDETMIEIVRITLEEGGRR
ncbi:MAG: protein kinase [Lachnospiraceae bacterium]|nr:protein kinase [Lachnospiraceae bacterium]